MVRRGRQAFTLIEILVVIGIILVLIGIAVLGFQHIDKSASEKTTKARLDTCTSILNEYEVAATTLNAIDSSTGNTLAIYYAGSTTTPAYPQVATPGDVNLGSANRAPVGGAVSVTNTGLILQAFIHVPAVKTEVSQLPAAALLNGYGTLGQTPLILDAWKNPIIYVPSGGLTGVTSNGRTVTVTSVDGRPFWASGGQDGNLTTGDDNIYSTNVVMK